jgi:hypothetical protein
LKIAQPSPEVLRRSHSAPPSQTRNPRLFGFGARNVSALWEIQFNLLIGAVREFGLLNSGRRIHHGSHERHRYQSCGPCCGKGLNDEPANLQLLKMNGGFRIGGRSIAYYLAQPDARREKKKKSTHTHTHTYTALRRRSHKIAVAH